MYDVPGRPVISGYGFYTENIPAFLDYQLKPIAMQVKSFIKHTNNFLKTPFTMKQVFPRNLLARVL